MVYKGLSLFIIVDKGLSLFIMGLSEFTTLYHCF